MNIEIDPPVPTKGVQAGFFLPEYLEALRKCLAPVLKKSKDNDIVRIRLSVKWEGETHEGEDSEKSLPGWTVVSAKRIEIRSDTNLATWSSVAFKRSFGKAKMYFVSGGIAAATVTGISCASANATITKQIEGRRKATETKRRARVVAERPDEYFKGKITKGRRISIAVDKKGRPKIALQVELRRYGTKLYRTIVQRRVLASGKFAKTGARTLWRAPKPERASNVRRVQKPAIQSAKRKTKKA